MKTHLPRLLTRVTALLFIAVGTVPAPAASVYLIGNSVTDGIKYNGLQALAQSRGFTHPWGRHMIPGSTLDWIWNNAGSGFTEPAYSPYNQALPN
jgi:hypothetical protein